MPSGVYHLTAEATGFGLLERTATVEAGTITIINLTLQVGELRANLTVDDSAPLIYSHLQMDVAP